MNGDEVLRALARLLAPYLDELRARDDAADTVTTVRLPHDVKNADTFNRACRSGRVQNARKRGRVWSCTRSAWEQRAPAKTPKGLPKRTKKTKAPTSGAELSRDMLDALGAEVA